MVTLHERTARAQIGVAKGMGVGIANSMHKYAVQEEVESTASLDRKYSGSTESSITIRSQVRPQVVGQHLPVP